MKLSATLLASAHGFSEPIYGKPEGIGSGTYKVPVSECLEKFGPIGGNRTINCKGTKCSMKGCEGDYVKVRGRQRNYNYCYRHYVNKNNPESGPFWSWELPECGKCSQTADEVVSLLAEKEPSMEVKINPNTGVLGMSCARYTGSFDNNWKITPLKMTKIKRLKCRCNRTEFNPNGKNSHFDSFWIFFIRWLSLDETRTKVWHRRCVWFQQLGMPKLVRKPRTDRKQNPIRTQMYSTSQPRGQNLWRFSIRGALAPMAGSHQNGRY